MVFVLMGGTIMKTLINCPVVHEVDQYSVVSWIIFINYCDVPSVVAFLILMLSLGVTSNEGLVHT